MKQINHLFTICDEIFNNQRVPIPAMVRDSEWFVLFPNFPDLGWKVEVYPIGDCFETYLFDKGGDVPCWVTVTGGTSQELETQLEFIHKWFLERKEKLANATATLTLNTTTPTTILRDLAARALGWVDRPYDPVENGSMWHCEAQNAPYGPSIPKAQWQPDQNADQTLVLIANLGINIIGNHDEEEIKTRVLIEAAKIGARKLGEKL